MRVYLAGPIAQTTDEEAYGWRELATAKLAEHGIEVHNPVKFRDFRGVEDTPGITAIIVEGDKADIQDSDVVLAYCWKVSVGTSQEVLFGYDEQKEVVVVVPPGLPVSPWLIYHATVVLHDLDEALAWIAAPRSEEATV